MLAQEVLSRTAARPYGLPLFPKPQDVRGLGPRGKTYGRISIDRDGCIDSVNGVAEALLGWRGDELLGKPVLALTGARTGQALVHGVAVLRALQHGRRLRLERTLFRCRDGEARSVSCAAVPRTDGSGGLVLTFQPWEAGTGVAGTVKEVPPDC